MNKRILKELKKKIGTEKVKYSDEYRVSYSFDATARKVKPYAVVFPESDKDVENILKIAFISKIPVVARGAGVGYTGGSVPVENSILIVFTKMNKIISLDRKAMTVEVEPGVVTGDLQDFCSKHGLFYPPDPASLKTSTIGGNVSENAGGPRCFKYGVTGDYVLKLCGYLVDGRKVEFGSSSIKDVAGYDLKSLITGSEGTLIVITKIILRLIPEPENRILIKLGFRSLRAGAEFIEKVILMNLNPSVLEFIDKGSIKAVYNYMNYKEVDLPGSIVLMELDGNKKDIETGLAIIREYLKIHNEVTVKIAKTEKEKENLWKIRRNISPAITKIKPKKINEDISVPRSKIPDTVDFINKLSNESSIIILLFGHFGDGNIHTNIMIDPENSSEVDNSIKILNKIFKYVISIGGTISGEHGIGLEKKKFLGLMYGKTEIEIFRGLKKVFDPENLLNPGKIF